MLIEALEFTPSTLRRLKKAGIITVEDFQDEDKIKIFLSERNLGRKILEELQEKIRNMTDILEKYNVIPYEIFADLKEYGYDSIKKVLYLSAFDLLRILSYDESKFRTVLNNLHENGYYLKEFQKKESVSLERYIEDTLKVSVERVVTDENVLEFLKKNEIYDVMTLKKYSIEDLEGMGMYSKNISALEYDLGNRHCPLRGDSIKRCEHCQALNAYVKGNVDSKYYYCTDCNDKIKRIEKRKEIEVDTELPKHIKLTSGKSGMCIMINIHNISRKILKIKIVDLYFVSLGKKWIPDLNLNGYVFDTEELLPDTLKSVAKIWTEGYWSYRELDNRDYLIVELNVNEREKQIFKFLYLNKQWKEFDFHVIKLKK